MTLQINGTSFTNSLCFLFWGGGGRKTILNVNMSFCTQDYL